MPPDASPGFSRLMAKYGLRPGAVDSPAAPSQDEPLGPASGLEYIDEAAREYGIDPTFLHGIARAESGYDPDAVSPKGAAGMFQFMPDTAREYGLRVEEDLDERRDPRKSARAAAAYLRDIGTMFPGRPDLQAAAYNAGPGNVIKHHGIPPFEETQNYVGRVLNGATELARAAPEGPYVVHEQGSPGFERLMEKYRPRLGPAPTGLGVLRLPQQKPEALTQAIPPQLVPAQPQETVVPPQLVPGQPRETVVPAAPGVPSAEEALYPRLETPGEDVIRRGLLELPAPVTPKRSEEFQRRQRMLGEWWQSTGRMMSHEQLAAASPEQQEFAAYARGQRPTIGPPPPESEMAPPALRRALAEQAAFGFLETATMGAAAKAPGLPEFVRWYAEAGPTGVGGALAEIAGSIPAFATPAPGPVLAQKAGQYVGRRVIGEKALAGAEEAAQAIYRTSLRDLLAKGAQPGEAQAEAARFAKVWAAQLLDKMAGRTTRIVAENVVQPAVSGATFGGLETSLGLARGDVQPEEVPAHLLGSSAGFVVAHIGFKGLAGLLRASGLVRGDLLYRLRRGEPLTPDEQTMMDGFAERVRQASAGETGPRGYEPPPPMIAGTPQPAPSGPPAPGEAVSHVEPPSPTVRGIIRRLQSSTEARRMAGATATQQATMAPLRQQAAQEMPYVTQAEIDAQETPEDLQRLIQVAKTRREAELETKRRQAAQQAAREATGLARPLPVGPPPQGAEIAAPGPPEAAAPLAAPTEAAYGWETQWEQARQRVEALSSTPLPATTRRSLTNFVDFAFRGLDRDQAVERARSLFGEEAMPLAGAMWDLRLAERTREVRVRELLGKATPEERVRLAKGESRYRVAVDIERRVSTVDLRAAAREPTTELGRAHDIGRAKELIGTTEPRPAAPSTAPAVPVIPSQPPPLAPVAPPQAPEGGLEPITRQVVAALEADQPKAIGLIAQDAYEALPESDQDAILAAVERAAERRPRDRTVMYPLAPQEVQAVLERRKTAGAAPEGVTERRGAPAVSAPKPKKPVSPYTRLLKSELGYWLGILVDEVGPVRIDTQARIAKGEGQDSTTGDLHPDTIKVLNDSSLGMVKGLLVASDGTPIDEAASYLAARGFAGGDETRARNELLTILMKVASDANAGVFTRLKKDMRWGERLPDISSGMIERIKAGDLHQGDDLVTHDGQAWVVESLEAGKIVLRRADGKKAKVDEFDTITVLKGMGPSRADVVGETRPPYGPSPTGRDWATASDELKTTLVRLASYHMRRGVGSEAALGAALAKEIGPGVQTFVPGLYRFMSKLPAFRKAAAKSAAPAPQPKPPEEVTRGPVQPQPVQPRPAGAAGGPPVRPAGGERRPGPPEAPRGGTPETNIPGASERAARRAQAVAPTREIRGGIATISRELMPTLEPQWQAVYERLTSPAAMESARKLFGKTPLPHQIETYVRIKQAHAAGRAYLAADGTGTGKTFTAGLTLWDAFEANQNARALVLVPNSEVANQWHRDILKPAGLHSNWMTGVFSVKPRMVNFMSYTRLTMLWEADQIGLVEGFNPDLLIFDESHYMRNFHTGETKRAQAGEYLTSPEVSKNVLFLSATPFESFLHTAYLTRTNVWAPSQNWMDWLARTLDITRDPEGGWMGVSPKKLKEVHRIFYGQGVMTRNTIDFAGLKNEKGESVALTSRNLVVRIDQAAKGEYDRIDQVFTSLLENLQEDPAMNRTLIRLVRGIAHLVRRSMDESYKLPLAIEHAKGELAKGKTVLFFLLRKDETSIEKWWRQYQEGKRVYKEGSRMPGLLETLLRHNIRADSPVAALQAAFPQAVKITGDEPSGGTLRGENIRKIQAGEAKVGIVTLAAGAESLNLQDVIGTHPRVSYIMSTPYTAMQVEQVSGRGFRLGSQSNGEINWLFLDTAQERTQASLVAYKMTEQHAMLAGQETLPSADEIEAFEFPELNVDRIKGGPDITTYIDEAAPGEFRLKEQPTLPGGRPQLTPQQQIELRRREIERRRYEAEHGVPPPWSDETLFGKAEAERAAALQGQLFTQPKTPSQEAYTTQAKRQGRIVRSTDSSLKIRAGPNQEFFPLYGAKVSGPDDVVRMTLGALKDRAHEAPYAVLTKDDGTAIGAVSVGIGRATGATINAWRMVMAATKMGAIKGHIVHNHPSGNPVLSVDDIRAANAIAAALREHGLTIESMIAIDIDKYGLVLPGGQPEVRDVPELGTETGTVPGIELTIEQRAQGIPIIKSLDAPGRSKAALDYMASLVSADEPTTAMMVLDGQNRVAGNIIFNAGFDAIVANEDAQKAARGLLAGTGAETVIFISNRRPAGRTGVRGEVSSIDTRQLLGPETAGYLTILDIIVPGEGSRPDAPIWRSATGFVPSGPGGLRLSEMPLGEPIKARRVMIDELMRALGTVRRHRRMGLGSRKLLGKYTPQTGVVRQRIYEDIETAAHEAGHRLDQLLFGLTPQGLPAGATRAEIRQFRGELRPIATKPRPGHDPVQEGIAEFVRMYMTNPAKARRVAPNFYPWFENRMNQADMRNIHEVMLGIRHDYEIWKSSSDEEQVGSTIASQAVPGNVFRRGLTFRHLYRYLFDNMTFVRQAVDRLQAMGTGPRPAPEQDARILATTFQGRWGIVDTMLRKMMVSFERPAVRKGPSLYDIMDALGTRWWDYEIYAKSRRAIDLHTERGWDPETTAGIPLEQARRIVARHNQEFSHAFQVVKGYHRSLAEYLRDGEMMTAEAFTDMVKANPDYSALLRLVEAETESPGFRRMVGGRLAGLTSPIKRIKGSSLPTLPSLEAAAKMTFLVVDRVERNQVLAQLVRLAQKTRGAGVEIAELVPEDRIPVTVTVATIMGKLRELGIDTELLGLTQQQLEQTLSLWIPSWFEPPAPYAWVWLKGKRRLVRLHPDVYETVMSMDRSDLPKWMEIFTVNARLLRAGAVVLDVGFWPWSAFRDVQTALIQSDRPIAYAANLLPALADAIFRRQNFWKYQVSGAAFSTFIRSEPVALARRLQRHREQNLHAMRYWSRPDSWARGLMGILNHVGMSIELMPRIAEMRARGLKGALTRNQLLPLGIAAAEATQDYRRVGTFIRPWSRVAAFLGAGMGGLDRPVRFFKDHPARFASWGALGVLMAVLYYLHNRKDDRWKQLPHEDRDLNWYFFADELPDDMVAVVPEPMRDVVLRLPKPYQFGYIASLTERFLEMVDEQNPELLDQLARDWARDSIPNPIPTGLQAPLEVLLNEKFHSGRPVAPEGRLPEHRYFPWTTEIAKRTGRVLQMSPAAIEHLAGAWSGGMAVDTLRLMDKYLLGVEPKRAQEMADMPVTGRWFARYPQISGEYVRRFYEAWEPAEQAYQSFRFKAQAEPNTLRAFAEERVDLLRRYYMLRGYQKAISSMTEAARRIDAEEGSSPEEKRQKIDAIALRLNLIAEQAVKMVHEADRKKASPENRNVQ